MKYYMKILQKNKITWVYIIAITALIFSFISGVLIGPTKLDFLNIFNGNLESPDARILLYVRLPRVLASVLCGMALAVSGAVIQAVLLNRLASPSIIGVNAGAGLAVTLCAAFGIMGGWQTSLFSFIGAFATVIIVSIGAKRWGASRGTVILMGVALNAFLGAISDTIATITPEVSIMSTDFKIGDFSASTYAKVFPAAILILVSVILLFSLSKELDVLTLGDETAKGLGLNAGLMRVIFLLLSALLAGAAVSVCGLLSFVGLLVPHAVRRIAATESKHLIPLCALFGAGFVSLCDTLARVVFAPFELPVGIIMAFLGAPFFIFILLNVKGGQHND